MPHQCTNCGRTFADGSKEMLSGCPDCGGNKFQFQPSQSAAERSAERSARSADRPAHSTSEPAASTGAPEPERDEPTGDPTTGERSGEHRPEADVEREMPELAKDADRDTVTAEDDSAGDPSRTHADVEREMPELAEDAAERQAEGAEYQTTTGEENAAQRDARSAPTTKAEIDEARRKMAEAAEERLADVAEGDDSGSQRPNRGRGTPQGPPTEPPDDDAAEEFGLSGPVGPPEAQPSTGAAGERGSEEEEEAIRGPNTDLSALREELNDQFESIKITAPGQYELNLMELYDRKEYIISLQEDGRYVVDIPEGHGLEE